MRILLLAAAVAGAPLPMGRPLPQWMHRSDVEVQIAEAQAPALLASVAETCGIRSPKWSQQVIHEALFDGIAIARGSGALLTEASRAKVRQFAWAAAETATYMAATVVQSSGPNACQRLLPAAVLVPLDRMAAHPEWGPAAIGGGDAHAPRSSAPAR